MVSFPHCKINLGLNILSKRNDGYHNLITCFYPIPLTDVLEIIPSEKFSFNTSGIPIDGSNDDNLSVKAYKLLSHDFKLPAVSIHLHKTIPSGAGLGGGSSDAAFTIRMLNELFNLKLSVMKMQDYASTLGSDCAFFVEDVPKLGTERGNVLAPMNIDLKGKFISLVKPNVHVSTAEAYLGVTPQKPDVPLEEVLKRPVHLWTNDLTNDFEKSVFRQFPEVAHIKTGLYEEGAVYASMSGSGACVYGIFEKSVSFGKRFEKYFCWTGIL